MSSSTHLLEISLYISVALENPPAMIVATNFFSKNGRSPSRPGCTKLKRLHSSCKLFCSGVPDSTSLWWALRPRAAA